MSDDDTSSFDAAAAAKAPAPMSPPVPTAAAVPPPSPVSPGFGPAPGSVTRPGSMADPIGPGPVAGPGPVPGVTPPAVVPPAWAPASAPRSATPPGLVAGVILVVIGGALLLGQLLQFSLANVAWPVWILAPGVAMLIGSFFIPARGGVGLAIAGAIVTIVGLILWVQDAYDLYATWAYAWALVAPTGVGLGMLLYGLVHRDAEFIGDGFRTMLVGLGLFLGFALFFEGVIGLSGAPIANLEQVLPYAIVGLGVLLVVLSFFGRRSPTPPAPR